jgi:hypothetical protein
LEQPPVSLRESLEEFTDFDVIAGHGPDQGNQFFADVFGDRPLLDFAGEMVAALGRVFMERPLEKIQSVVDLALELFLAELKDFGLFAHKYAYIYAYYES